MIVQDGNTLAKYSDNVAAYVDTIVLFVASTTGNSWTSLGCYTDSISARTLTHYVTVPGGQGATTIEACQATCHALGYILAGVEYAGECCKHNLTLYILSYSLLPLPISANPLENADIFQTAITPYTTAAAPLPMATPSAI